MFDFRTASPALSLPFVIRGLRVAVGDWGVRRLLAAVLVMVLQRRLGEVLRRLERMMVRFAAGRVMRCAPRVVVREAGGDRAAREVAARVLPVEFGWLLKVGTHVAAGFGAHLRLVLEHPEMVALLEASPQAGRLLGPICRALGIERSVLRIPRVARPARVARVVQPKATWVSGGVEGGRLVWPRGVLAAARTWRVLKGG